MKKLWMALMLSFILTLGACGTDSDNKDTNKETPEENIEKDGDTTTKKDEITDGKDVVVENGEPADDENDQNQEANEENNDEGKIDQGTYKVGTDIAAGEYLVFAQGMAYIENASDSTGNLDSIIFNDNLMNDAHSYVTLKDGEYFKLTSGYMYPVDKAPSVQPDDGLYKDGMYKVGTDIPAGEYKVKLDNSTDMGYLEVSTNSRHDLSSIVTNEIVQADMYITVKDGQYIKLQGVSIQK
ncbi:hypothetical protein [Lederbergia graminis]|uniref:Lipoprotein n=1 Tax=Lederbergia graminis TaxID=735518 RepID=A0ABW0LM05_9BACI|nr:hypothetical protein [Paenibacillus bovis]